MFPKAGLPPSLSGPPRPPPPRATASVPDQAILDIQQRLIQERAPFLPPNASSLVPKTPPKSEPKAPSIKLGSVDPMIEQVRSETGERFEPEEIFTCLNAAKAKAEAKYPWS
eukprot:8556909-Karenia_brevis.AAC.1